MTLRIMLLGLVASMGFELPSGPEVSSWAQAGRDWAHARLLDLSGPLDEADRPVEGPADCHRAEMAAPAAPAAVVDDSAFLAASTTMAAEFAADALATRDQPPAIEDAPASLAIEAPEAVGLPEGEEIAAMATPEAEMASVEVVESAEPAGWDDESSSRADRITSAIRLTREAARAWVDLIQESADDPGPAR